MFEVILSPEAQSFFAAADRPLALNWLSAFWQQSAIRARHNNIKRLSGRFASVDLVIASADWRVIYRIEDRIRQVQMLLDRTSK